MPKKIDFVIKESISELKILIHTQTTIGKRNKLQALYLVKTEQCSYLSDVAKLLLVHRTTISKWFSIYQKYGLRELLENSRKQKSGRKSFIDDCIVEELQKLLKRNYFQSYREVQSWLQNNYQLCVEDYIVYNLVHYRLRHDLAKPTQKF